MEKQIDRAWRLDELAKFLDGELVQEGELKSISNFGIPGCTVYDQIDFPVAEIVLDKSPLKVFRTPSELASVVIAENVSSVSSEYKGAIIKIKEPELVLKKLAKYGRSANKGKIIQIIGTVGKTNTKNTLVHLLKPHGNVINTFNSNNVLHPGQAVLASCNKDTDYAIIETSEHYLGGTFVRLVSADIIMITQCCVAHADKIKVTNDKEMAIHLTKPCASMQKNGIVIANREINTFDTIASEVSRHGKKLVSYGFDKRADTRIIDIKALDDKFGVEVFVKIYEHEFSYYLPYYGQGMAINSLGVLTCLYHLGHDPKEASKEIASYSGIWGRQTIENVKLENGDAFRIIDDCYNAQPTSIIDAIKTLKFIPNPNGRKVLVLGELKSWQTEELKKGYFDFVPHIYDANPDAIILIGEMARIKDSLPKDKVIATYASRDIALDKLDEIIGLFLKDDLVYIKVRSDAALRKNLANRIVEAVKKQ